MSRLILVSGALLVSMGCADKEGALPTQQPTVQADRLEGIPAQEKSPRVKRRAIDPTGYVGHWAPDMKRLLTQPAFAALNSEAQATAIAMIEDVSFRFNADGTLNYRTAGVQQTGRYTVISQTEQTVHLKFMAVEGLGSEELHLTLDAERDDWMRIRTQSGAMELKRQ